MSRHDVATSWLTSARDAKAELIEFNRDEDHVHLMIRYPPTLEISKLVNSLKGVSSRLLGNEFWPHLRKYLWANRLWPPSYFAASCGPAPLEIVKQYIANQKTPAA
jgi:putative transposase